MLDELALRGRCPFDNCPIHENDKFLDAGSLKVPEMADIRCVRQDYGIGSIWIAFQIQKVL